MVETRIFQLKISLDGIQPPIWRRIQVPGDTSLLELHFIFQIAMGWTNSHLHEFLIDSDYYGTPLEDEWEYRELRNEQEYQLAQVIPTTDFQFEYLYDFGDSWKHIVLVEEILEPAEGQGYPACLDGACHCPPEDVGGTWGYEEFLEAIADPNHPEHEDYLTWVGGSFDPQAFDPKQIDTAIKDIERSEMVRVYRRYYADEHGPELKLYQAVSSWIETLTAVERTQIAELPLRQDTVSLLTYLHDHRITGTQSTGNLPRKAIREVTASFVHPPVLDNKIGERVYKLRSEYEVWPVYYIHTLLEVGGLLEGGPGRRLRLTSKGEQFLEADDPIQVWYLLETWWHHTNWLIAYPFIGMGEELPYGFTFTTLEYLLMLPVGRAVLFEDFADRIIQTTRLKWEAQESTHARRFLHGAIERMVIDILADFGAAIREQREVGIGDYHDKKLHAFSLTKSGKGLLLAVAGGSL